MTRPRSILVEGRRYLWSDLLHLRREQKPAHAGAEQLPLFELKHDPRPASERTAARRYLEPSLFSDL